MVNIHRSSDLESALKILQQDEMTVIAGGTDVMVHYNSEHGVPDNKYSNVISIDNIGSLKQIDIIDINLSENNNSENHLQIGSMVTLTQLEKHPYVPKILQQTIPKMAAPAIRNRATIGGNICNASPAADTLPALYLLDAKVVLSSLNRERVVPIEEFILAPGKTVLQSNELLTSILIPQYDTPLHFYHKVGTRTANALTKLSVSGVAKIEKSCTNEWILKDWRLAFGAVAPTVVRDRTLENLIVGQPLDRLTDPDVIELLISSYGKKICPIDDQRSTADYRRNIAIKLMTRWIRQLAMTSRAKG